MKPTPAAASRESGAARGLVRRSSARLVVRRSLLGRRTAAAVRPGWPAALRLGRDAPCCGTGRGVVRVLPRRRGVRRVRRRLDLDGDEPGGGEQTLEELWRAPGDDVAVVPGTSSYEPGRIRVIVSRRRLRGAAGHASHGSRLGRAWRSRRQPFLETEAKLERIGVPGGAEADATHIYVAQFELRKRRQVLDARRAGGRARSTCRRSGTSWSKKTIAPPGVGDPRAGVEDADADSGRRRRSRS